MFEENRMEIRRAKKNDLQQIIEIYSMDGITGDREIVTPNITKTYKIAFKQINDDPNQLLLVADDFGQIKGTLQVTSIQYLIAQSYKRSIVEAIFIHPEWQGKGIGRLLMRAAEEWAQRNGCNSLELTTNRERTDAHQFYKKINFLNDRIAFKKNILRESNNHSILEHVHDR